MQSRRSIATLFLLILALVGAWRLVVITQDHHAAAPEAVAVAMTEADEARFDDLREILALASTGREAMSVMADHEVGVKFVAGGGSYYLDAVNTIVIEASHPPVRAALSFVHEMVHAQYWLDGRTADIKSDSRHHYVSRRVEEETEAVVASIVAKNELQQAGVRFQGARAPLEDKYQAAYQAAIEDAHADQPYRSANEFRTIGQEAGKSRVLSAFADGELLTSNTGEPYATYYGNDWDDKH